MLISYYKTVIILHTCINYCTLYHEPWTILNHLRQKLTLLETKNMHTQCTRTVKPLYSGPSVKQPPHELRVLQPATEVTCDTCIMPYMYIHTLYAPYYTATSSLQLQIYAHRRLLYQYRGFTVQCVHVHCLCQYRNMWPNKLRVYWIENHNSLGHEQPSCLDVKQSPNGKYMYMYMRTCLCNGTIHTLSVWTGDCMTSRVTQTKQSGHELQLSREK